MNIQLFLFQGKYNYFKMYKSYRCTQRVVYAYNVK